jgi:hypothetical protein
VAKISKEFDLYAWRHNNINIVAVSKEHNGKQLTFNLYTDSNKNKALNSTSNDYIPHLYVDLPNNKSAYVIGILDKVNSKVTFTLESCMLPSCGRFNCFVSLICDDVVIKFAGMTLCVLNGDISRYVDNTSKRDSYDVLVSNVNYLMSKIDNVVSDFNITNLEALGSYPNLSNNCMKVASAFESTNYWTVNNGGELVANEHCLIVKNTKPTDLLGKLSTEKDVDNTATMLVKLRIKMLEGSYICVYPIYSTCDNSINVVTDTIVASNLRHSSNDFLITDNEWHNIWFIFSCNDTSSVSNVGVRLAPSANVAISNFNVFYSLDTCGTNKSGVIESNIEAHNTTKSINEVQSNISVATTPYSPYEEGAI